MIVQLAKTDKRIDLTQQMICRYMSLKQNS
jgi:hypothetical protein